MTTTAVTIRDAVADGLQRSLTEKVAQLIVEIAQYRGKQMSSADALIAAGYYVEDLKRDFPRLATTDIRQIMWRGVRKEFGDYFGLNAGTFYDWTVAYIDTPAYQLQLRERQAAEAAKRPQIAAKATPTADDDRRVMVDSINNAYRRYLANDYKPAAAGSIGATMQQHYAGGYPIGHPLCDLGGARRQWLNENGVAGTLAEIFEKAKAAGKAAIL